MTMKNNAKFEATLRKSRLKYMPKKLLKHKKISITAKYTFNASVWIPNTPESNLRPAVCLKLQHSDQDIRLCFNTVAEMILAIEELCTWAGSFASIAHLKHEEAVREWLEFHESQLSPSINDYTYSTVIQEKKDKGREVGGDLEDGKGEK